MATKSLGPILSPLDQIAIENDAWLWPGRIPLGAITTLVGFGGEGKSFLACAVASAVSRGGTFPDGSPAPLGGVVIMAGEDSPSKLRLRYTANGADLPQVQLLQGQRIYTKNGPADVNVTLRDIDLIRAAVDQAEVGAPGEGRQAGVCPTSGQVWQAGACPTGGAALPVKLLIIDPIGDFIPGINSDKDNEVRALLNPLAQLAHERQLAVLLICHRKKGAGDRADNAALGSVAFTSKARAVHHVILDPYDTAHPSERRRFFLPGKMNDQQQSQGLAFKIVAPDGVVTWEADPITHTADAIMQYAAAKARANRTANPDAVTEAMKWLAEALKDGPRAARELSSEARAEGIAPFALRRAREKLGVRHGKFAYRGASIWQLPGHEGTPAGLAEKPPEKLPEKLPLGEPGVAPGDGLHTEDEGEVRYHPAFPPPRIRRRPAA